MTTQINKHFKKKVDFIKKCITIYTQTTQHAIEESIKNAFILIFKKKKKTIYDTKIYILIIMN